MSVSAGLRSRVRIRADDCCEYCRLRQVNFPLVVFHVEHVIARQHGGTDEFDNLCLACHWCNLFKGPNISSLYKGKLTPLFNPRLDIWEQHFELVDGQIDGISPVGNVTVRLLNMNNPDRVELRRLL